MNRFEPRFACGAALLLTVVSGSFAAEPAPKPKPTSNQISSTALLYGRQPMGTLQSTAVVVDAERHLLLTAWHFWPAVENHASLMPIYEKGSLEVAPSPYMNLYLKGKAAPAKLVWYDSSSDLALVEVESLPKLTSAVLASTPAKRNEPVFALGNPPARNAMWQMEEGRVSDYRSAEWTYVNGQRIVADVLEFTVSEPLSTGFSGGPVFNGKGEVAGMIIATAKPDGSAIYAVDAATIDRFMSRAHSHLALAKSTPEFKAAALRHANLAVGLGSQDPCAYLVRGWLRLRQRRSDDAWSDWRAAYESSPVGKELRRWGETWQAAQETLRQANYSQTVGTN